MSEQKGKRLAAASCALSLLFCLAVGLGVHGAFQYQAVRQERLVSAEDSRRQTKNELEQSKHQRETKREQTRQTTEKPVQTTTRESGTASERTAPATQEAAEPERPDTSAPSRREPSSLPRGVLNDKKVYLTFDDGPSPNTLKILQILKEHNAKATFFVVNSKYNSYMKQIVEGGNAIALHTFTHNYKKIYQSETAWFGDLQKISDVVKRETGVEAKVIRFPGGSSNTVSSRYNKGIMSRLTRQTEQKGYVYFDWNCSSGDANGDGIAASVLVRNVKSGTKHMNGHIIILMHDSQAKTTTVEALPAILKHFQERGFTFEVITAETPVVHHGVNN